jgi:hypothetical protein
MVERVKPQLTLRRTRFACWISRATYKHSEYVLQYLSLLSCKIGCTNTPHGYVMCAFPVLLARKQLQRAYWRVNAIRCVLHALQ